MLSDNDLFLVHQLLPIEFIVSVPVIKHKVPVFPLLAYLFIYGLLSLLYFLRDIELVLLHDPLEQCPLAIVNLLLVLHALVVFL